MRKSRVMVFITVILALLLSACSVYSGSGTVTSRSFQPQHTVLMPMMCGKVTCLMPVHYDDEWTVEVASDAYEKPFTLEVSEETWNHIQLGATVTFENSVIVNYTNP